MLPYLNCLLQNINEDPCLYLTQWNCFANYKHKHNILKAECQAGSLFSIPGQKAG